MGRARALLRSAPEPLTRDVLFACACLAQACSGILTSGLSLGVTVWYLSDWFYVVLTLVVFGVLLLIVKGIESFER
jgi:uncharacterized membrane protein